MITVKDVAKKAGVAVSTASYALNGNGTISDATRKKVLSVAEELNYHPNGAARSLKNRKTNTIGVFISRFGGSFYEDILEGIHNAAMKYNYELIVCPESETTHKILTQRQVDGAIIFDSKINSELLKKLASRNFPIVTMDRILDVDNTYSILIDNHQGAKQAFMHLFDQGFRRIAYIEGSKDALDNSERTEAFLEEAGKHPVSVMTYQGDFTEKSGRRIARTIISTNKLPEAVFCANDQMAIGFLEAMREFNLKAPEDIAVVGFDDINIAKYMQPTLSTVGVSRFDWGSLAAGQLIELLENDRAFDSFRIRAKLIERESSKQK